MIDLAPMPLVDDFLVQYHVGQAILLLFILVIPVGVIKKSARITGANVMLFGLLFLLVPALEPGVSLLYAIFGIALVVLGPVIYTTGSR